MHRAFNPRDAGSTPVMPTRCSDDVTDSILVCQAWRAGSNPVQSFWVSWKADYYGNIALVAELSAVNRMVAGSNPAVPSQEHYCSEFASLA